MARVAGHGRTGGAGQGPGWAGGAVGGRLVATGDRWEPYRLVDAEGVAVGAAGAYFGHLQAAGRSELTVRSYGMDLLRWFRFLRAADVAWNHAVRSARDFCRWLQVAGKPVRPHWREQDGQGAGSGGGFGRGLFTVGSRALRDGAAQLLRLHVEAGTGPLVNPFPLDRSRRGGRAHAHHNPMEPFRPSAAECTGRRCRPGSLAVSRMRIQRIFAALSSHRDRALVAFYVSTGARASEMLSATRGGQIRDVS